MRRRNRARRRCWRSLAAGRCVPWAARIPASALLQAQSQSRETVEGKIEPAECRQRLCDHHFDIALFRDVSFDEDRLAAQRFDLGDDVMAFFLAASADDDLRAMFGKLEC